MTYEQTNDTIQKMSTIVRDKCKPPGDGCVIELAGQSGLPYQGRRVARAAGEMLGLTAKSVSFDESTKPGWLSGILRGLNRSNGSGKRSNESGEPKGHLEFITHCAGAIALEDLVGLPKDQRERITVNIIAGPRRRNMFKFMLGVCRDEFVARNIRRKGLLGKLATRLSGAGKKSGDVEAKSAKSRDALRRLREDAVAEDPESAKVKSPFRQLLKLGEVLRTERVDLAESLKNAGIKTRLAFMAGDRYFPTDKKELRRAKRKGIPTVVLQGTHNDLIRDPMDVLNRFFKKIEKIEKIRKNNKD